MDTIKKLVLGELNLINNELADIEANNYLIFEDLKKFLNGKSKRIRSLITILYLKANNISISDDIIKLLSACELIHNASLLHDDVVDDSPLRRGMQTLYNKYSSKLSVISGDYILSIAVENLIKLNNNEILNLFFNTVKNMSEAEISQYFSRNSDVTFENYLEIIQGKTSSLFAACMQAAAILTGLDVNKAEKFGKIFGLIFQINNDLESESAKNDNKNGVKTAVDILGIEKTLALKDNYKEELREILTRFPNNRYTNGIKDLISLL